MQGLWKELLILTLKPARSTWPFPMNALLILFQQDLLGSIKGPFFLAPVVRLSKLNIVVSQFLSAI